MSNAFKLDPLSKGASTRLIRLVNCPRSPRFGSIERVAAAGFGGVCLVQDNAWSDPIRFLVKTVAGGYVEVTI